MGRDNAPELLEAAMNRLGSLTSTLVPRNTDSSHWARLLIGLLQGSDRGAGGVTSTRSGMHTRFGGAARSTITRSGSPNWTTTPHKSFVRRFSAPARR